MVDDLESYYVQERCSLSTNKAGASARAKAAELRKAAPVKSAFARILGVPTSEYTWAKGAQGEEALADYIHGLKTEGWHLIDDIQIGRAGANVDHLVIGPPGVFCINTKNLSGKVWVASRTLMVNGVKTNFLPKAHREGERVQKRLHDALGHDVSVQPVLAVFAPSLDIRAMPFDVHVVTGQGCRKWLKGLPARFSPREIFAIASAADDPATWRDD